jgi:hypothetical protein
MRETAERLPLQISHAQRGPLRFFVPERSAAALCWAGLGTEAEKSNECHPDDRPHDDVKARNAGHVEQRAQKNKKVGAATEMNATFRARSCSAVGFSTPASCTAASTVRPGNAKDRANETVAAAPAAAARPSVSKALTDKWNSHNVAG